MGGDEEKRVLVHAGSSCAKISGKTRNSLLAEGESLERVLQGDQLNQDQLNQEARPDEVKEISKLAYSFLKCFCLNSHVILLQFWHSLNVLQRKTIKMSDSTSMLPLEIHSKLIVKDSKPELQRL